MNKRFKSFSVVFIVMLLVTSMAFFLVSCGDNKDSSNEPEKETPDSGTDNATSDNDNDNDTADNENSDDEADDTTDDETIGGETEEKNYTFENGVYSTRLFSVKVPDGWVVDEKVSSDETARFYRTADAEKYDIFKEAGLMIRISDFSFTQDRGTLKLDEAVENDKQFFIDKNPESIVDYQKGEYVGKQLLGGSSNYKDGKIQYINAELWQADSNNRSDLDISTLYYDSEQQKEIEEILNSIEFKLTGELTNDGSASGPISLDLTGCSLELTDNKKGWYIESSGENRATLESNSYATGSVSIVCEDITDGNNSEAQAASINENFGGGLTIGTVDFNGKTYYTLSPIGGQIYYLTDSSDNTKRIKVSTMFMNENQVSEIMQALVIK